MLTARKSEPIKFNQAKIRFLELDKNLAIIGASPVVYCGTPVVGFKRFFEARTAGVSADLVVTVPRTAVYYIDSLLVEVERLDRKGKAIYRIVQVQDRFDSTPPCYQLTLVKEKVKYVDQRNA